MVMVQSLLIHSSILKREDTLNMKHVAEYFDSKSMTDLESVISIVLLKLYFYRNYT